MWDFHNTLLALASMYRFLDIVSLTVARQTKKIQQPRDESTGQ